MSSLEPVSTSARVAGQVLAHYAFDVGFQIDLERAAEQAREATRHRVVRTRRPAPQWFDYDPAPVLLSLPGDSVEVGGLRSDSLVEAIVFDFGTVLLTYRFPLEATLGDLPALGAQFHDAQSIGEDARRRAGVLLDVIRSAVERPELGSAEEDYTVFSITEWDPAISPIDVADRATSVLAQAIEGETAPLAPLLAERALAGRLSYTADDVAIVDWNAAILFDAEPADVVAVLKHANVELLELRVLDAELDELLDHADETLSELLRRRLWPGFQAKRILGRYATAQTDAAVMFEGVNNAIKLLGNQYLARVYRIAARRLDLPAWQASVQRKLEATESLYQKMSDAASTGRLETLEWVIVILIAISMILPFMPWYGH
ncbi:MAG: hypothetical protein R3F20_12645 [Planctomycetota bacterium]